MKMLLDELLKMKNPFACAHGRPTMIVIPFSELEKRFERK
jgi:DNA mismatch repair protein MutL